MIVMSLSDALDYSVGRYLTALKKSRGKKRDAIHMANWADVAISLRSSIDQLPAKGTRAMYAHTAKWNEHNDADHLWGAQASAIAVVGVVQKHWDEHHTACEACDRVKGALEDAHVAVNDLTRAMGL
jgi:hypothetical protein